MKHAINILICSALLLVMASCRPAAPYTLTAEENRVMREQADAFLRSMPDGLQNRQTMAIRKAIEGDCSRLDSVRQSRNAAPQTSANVEIRMLSPALRLYEPQNCSGQRLPLLIYLHGGGWTFGSLNSCGRFCNAMAESGGIKVLAVDYKLAPEHPFPAGLDDCIEAMKYAQENAELLGIESGRISVGGDSSGGNLAIATALSESCRGQVKSLVLFYPVTKAFDDASQSWAEYGFGYGLDSEIMCEFNRAYLASHSPRDERISVGLCSKRMLRELPPTLLVAAGRDILRDQGIEFAQRAGRRITRIEFPEAVHLFITVPGQDLAFDKAVELATDFIL